MIKDNNPSKDAQELKELTKVIRSIDLDTKEPNETSMTNANGDKVIYHPNSMPPDAKREYLEGLEQPESPKTAAEIEKRDRELQEMARESWSKEEEDMQ